MLKNEIWDLYDKDGNFHSKFTKGKGMIPDFLYHKTVEVIPTDMEGNLLLVRRSMQKKIGAGQLEFPAGSVISGEDEKEAAIRELKEETGLRPAKLYFLQYARTKGIMRYTYLAFIPDMTKKQFACDPNEVSGFRIASYDQWLELLFSGEYNHFRVQSYNEKLLSNVQSLVNRFATATAPKKEHAPLRSANGLVSKMPRHLDERCYEKEDVQPPGLQEQEPVCEQGDDGT